jgi:hypothetical protein
MSECLEFHNAVHTECAIGLGALTVVLSRPAVNVFPQIVLVPERSSWTLSIVENNVCTRMSAYVEVRVGFAKFAN